MSHYTFVHQVLVLCRECGWKRLTFSLMFLISQHRSAFKLSPLSTLCTLGSKIYRPPSTRQMIPPFLTLTCSTNHTENLPTARLPQNCHLLRRGHHIRQHRRPIPPHPRRSRQAPRSRGHRRNTSGTPPRQRQRHPHLPKVKSNLIF